MNTVTQAIQQVEKNTDNSASLSSQLEHIKSSYPAYYRAWKSMITSYGVNEVISEWRGTFGLMRFIEDSSILADSPTFLPDVSVRLKRKIASFQFDKDNVYWKIPLAVQSKAARIKAAASTNKFSIPSIGMVQCPASPVQHPASISALKSLYPTPEAIDTRMDELFTIQFEGAGLTELQAAELDVLGILSKEEEITPSTPFTDI